MTTLAAAVERREWEFVALKLLIGVSKAARLLPAESLDELVQMLSPRPKTEDVRGSS